MGGDAQEVVAEVCEDPGVIGAEGEEAVGSEGVVEADLGRVVAVPGVYRGSAPERCRPTSSASFGHGPPLSFPFSRVSISFRGSVAGSGSASASVSAGTVAEGSPPARRTQRLVGSSVGSRLAVAVAALGILHPRIVLLAHAPLEELGTYRTHVMHTHLSEGRLLFHV